MSNVKVFSFWSKVFKRLLSETHVFGRTFIFYIFLCDGGSLNLLRHVVDLSVSLTMSQPAATTWKLSMSRLDFLILVLQNSNGFDLISIFFKFCFNLFPNFYAGHIQLMLLGSMCSTGIFLKVKNNVSVLVIVLNLQTVFPLKPTFSKGPSFFVLLFVIMGLWICACKS